MLVVTLISFMIMAGSAVAGNDFLASKETCLPTEEFFNSTTQSNKIVLTIEQEEAIAMLKQTWAKFVEEFEQESDGPFMKECAEKAAINFFVNVLIKVAEKACQELCIKEYNGTRSDLIVDEYFGQRMTSRASNYEDHEGIGRQFMQHSALPKMNIDLF